MFPRPTTKAQKEFGHSPISFQKTETVVNSKDFTVELISFKFCYYDFTN